MAQMDFDVIKRAFAKRYPDIAMPEAANQEMTATNLAQQTDMGTETRPQELNSIGGAKSEAQKIVEILGSRLKKLA